jgi:tRNA threonylcarbamoyladenosine biosynthesis protein TsaE
MEHLVTRSEAETISAGEKFAERLIAGDVVALFGDLGSGKTRFAKGVSLGLGVKEHVTSPTFVVVNEHLGGRVPFYHFDFYRLRNLQELQEIGFDDYVYGNGVCLLEWAEAIQERLPLKRYDVHLSFGSHENERLITIEQR